MIRTHMLIQGGTAAAVLGLALFFAGEAATQPAPPTGQARQFETRVAPLLARYCLGCHNADARKGGLDLSRKETALAGGQSGRVIVPGKAAESLLWKHVASDRMPPEGRPRPSVQEKAFLRQWIDGGAVWSGAALDPATPTPGAASANWLRRLTVSEYIETVRSAVGVDVERDARRMLPPDLRADGFSNTAYNLSVDLGHVEAYARLAQIIVGRMDVPAFVSRYAGSRELTEANLRKLIAGMGRWLLRGPMDEPEVTTFVRVANGVKEEGGDFHEAAGYVLQAMLQSPRFLYRIERQAGDGKPRRVAGYELASRLSYIVWGGPPDEELLRAAGAGELGDRNRLAAQVRRMLQDPRAVKRSSQFMREWLDLDRLESLRPDRRRFPTWDAQLAADMRAETLSFFEEIAWKQKRPLWDLMNAPFTFATPRLAAHYGLPWNPAGKDREGLLALYTFDEGSGSTVRDTSGAGEPLDLKIEDPSKVRWESGRLVVTGPTLIAAAAPPKRLIDAMKQSNAVTLEAWITPAEGEQSGPARILTLSSGPNERNFTVGQENDRFEVRFRGTRTDANGQPALNAGGRVQSRLTHVVYTRDPAGRARLFVDGEERQTRDTGGNLSNWSEGYRLALANETTKDRPWRGAFHSVALYSRALAPEEIRTRAVGMTRYDLTSVPGRRGLLTHGSVLTVGGDDASMVARGLFVLHDLLYSKVGSAPPGVDTTPVPTKAGQSQRAIAEVRLADRACGGCHARFEPLAFGLEKFDGIGGYHEVDEHGNKLREDGQILFPGQAKPVPYRTTAEFVDLLARSDRVRMNFTRKLTQFALGRPLTDADGPTLEKVHRAAVQGGGTYPSLITAIVMSDLVQMTQTEKQR